MEPDDRRDLVEDLTWARERFEEHLSAVDEIRQAGLKGDMFALADGLAQLRHRLNLNSIHLMDVLRRIQP